MKKAAAPASAADAGGAKPQTVSPTGLPSVPTMRRAEGAIFDLAAQRCNVEPGRQVARAAITSSAKKTMNYLVTVSWTTATGDVLARGYDRVVGLTVGETKSVAIKSTVPSGAGRCVWGVERADAK